MADGGTGAPIGGKSPGWYPAGTNPNDQGYWDGNAWTARRQWSGAGWFEVPAEPAGEQAESSVSGPPAAAPNAATAPPWAWAGVETAKAGQPATTPVVAGRHVFRLLCGVALIVGSMTSWVSISIFGHSIGVSGTNRVISTAIGVNGWITFFGGLALVLLSAAMTATPEASLRKVTAVVGLVTFAFATYDFARILQKLSGVHAPGSNAPQLQFLAPTVSVGFGLVIVFIAGVAALLVAVADLRS